MQEQIKTNADDKSTFSNETNFTQTNLEEKEYDEEEFNILFDNIKELAKSQEIELKQEIENVKSNEVFNISLNNALEKAFKESIFEFKIIGLVANNKEAQRKVYEEKKKIVQIAKQKYYSMQLKFLFLQKF